jgi:hypothetical protein
MAIYLRVAGALVVALSVLCGAAFIREARGDEAYHRAKMMRERNAGNVLFESEFRVAEARHVFIIYSAVGCFLTALVGGSLLWGLGSLHAKIDRRGA